MKRFFESDFWKGIRIPLFFVLLLAAASSPVVLDLVVKKSPWSDVRAYGAVLDNTTDDSDAFLAAVAAQPSSGGTILVPGYMALGSNMLISGRKNITVAGIGKGASGIKFLNNGTLSNNLINATTTFLMIFDNCTNITIRDLDWDISLPTQAIVGVYRTTGFSFRNNHAHGIASVSNPVCVVHTSAVNESEYLYNVIDNTGVGFCNGTGWAAEIDNNVQYIGNRFYRQKGNPIIGTQQNTRIMGNYFGGYSIKVKIAGGPIDNVVPATAAPENITISGNVFDWYTSDSIQSMGVSFGANQNGIGPRNISITGNVFRNAPSGIDVAEASGVTISGNTFDNCGTGINTSNVDNMAITGNTIISQKEGAAGIGLQSNTVDRRDSGDIVIANNTISLPGAGSYGIIGNHDNVYKTYRVKIEGNSINVGGKGIDLIEGFRNFTIKHNRIVSTGHYALVYRDTSCTGEVYGNDMSGYYGDFPDWSSTCRAWWYTAPSPDANYTDLREAVGTAAPTWGTWGKGDFVRNVAVDNVIGWKCTAAGSPGTWKAMTITLEP